MERGQLTFDDHQVSWYSAGPRDAELTLLWHHGTPNTGEPPSPLVEVAVERGLRVIGFDRLGYGDSSDAGAHSVGQGARVAQAVLDELSAGAVIAVGYSGGGPYALASAVAMPERVKRVVLFASLAPFITDREDPRGLGPWWWRGMHGPGLREVLAALRGGAALKRHLDDSRADPPMFNDRDMDALKGRWSCFEGIAARAVETGIEGVAADDLAYVRAWGFSVMDVAQPVLVVHGEADMVVPARHGRWLARAMPDATLTVRSGDGHLSALNGMDDALEWIAPAR